MSQYEPYFEEYVPSSDSESDRSFELLPRPLHSQRNIVEELDLPDPILDISNIENADPAPITFEFISNGTSKGKTMVSSSHGYTYVKANTVKQTTYWQCSKRNTMKGCRCPATVRSKDGGFTAGKKSHNHPADFSDKPKRLVYRDAKREGLSDLYKPAQSIAEKILSPVFVNDVNNSPNIPLPKNIARATNRQRQQQRPTEPVDLSFTIDDASVEGFLQADVKCGENRHLIFATNTQLFHLAEARRWYGDGTFKVIKVPFVQLYSFHAFIKKGDATKQVPLAYIFMSGKRKGVLSI